MLWTMWLGTKIIPVWIQKSNASNCWMFQLMNNGIFSVGAFILAEVIVEKRLIKAKCEL